MQIPSSTYLQLRQDGPSQERYRQSPTRALVVRHLHVWSVTAKQDNILFIKFVADYMYSFQK